MPYQIGQNRNQDLRKLLRQPLGVGANGHSPLLNIEAMRRLLTLRVFERVYSCDNSVRSPLTPLQKGGTEKLLKVPLFKGDLGGSKLRTVVIKAN